MNFENHMRITGRAAKMMVNAAMNRFEKSESGESPIKALVMIVVVAILTGALLGTGIDALNAGSNESGTWSAAQVATYGVIGILILVAVILLIVRVATE
jgi:hypothetical protein